MNKKKQPIFTAVTQILFDQYAQVVADHKSRKAILYDWLIDTFRREPCNLTANPTLNENSAKDNRIIVNIPFSGATIAVIEDEDLDYPEADPNFGFLDDLVILIEKLRCAETIFYIVNTASGEASEVSLKVEQQIKFRDHQSGVAKVNVPGALHDKKILINFDQDGVDQVHKLVERELARHELSEHLPNWRKSGFTATVSDECFVIRSTRKATEKSPLIGRALFISARNLIEINDLITKSAPPPRSNNND